MTTIDERLMNLLVHYSGNARENIAADAELDDIGLDSLTRFELFIDIEDEFGIAIEDDAVLLELKTVQDMVDLVKKLEAVA